MKSEILRSYYFIHEKTSEKERANHLSSELKNLLENVNLFTKTYGNN